MRAVITPHTLSGEVNMIASKSQAHRALILASIAEGVSFIRCEELNEDIEATVFCLKKMGADIIYEDGVFKITPIVLPEGEVFMDCAESGSTLRFLLPLICALGIKARIKMHGRLYKRPLEPLKSVLISHGAKITQKEDELFIEDKISAGNYEIEGNVSSQYITGLLFALLALREKSTLKVIGELQSASYVKMTLDAIESFSVKIFQKNGAYVIKKEDRLISANIRVEGDWSNAAFWICAAAMGNSRIKINNLNINSSQGDKKIIDILREMGANIIYENGSVIVNGSPLSGVKIDASDIPDLIPVLSAAACAADGTTIIVNAQRLRLKESDRLKSIYDMLTEVGADIKMTEDGLIISGKKTVSGGTVDSRNDHRMAMTAAVLSVISKGELTVLDAGAVKKSYPAFWEEFIRLGGALRRYI